MQAFFGNPASDDYQVQRRAPIRLRRFHGAAWVAACLAVCLLILPTRAQETPNNEARLNVEEGPLLFRRVRIPQDQQVPPGVRPVYRDEFEKAIQLIERLERTPNHASPQLQSAQYEVSIFPERLAAEGQARIEVRQRASDGQFARLEPLNVAVGKAQWETSQAAARLGGDPGGRMALLVDRSGTIVFPWTRRMEDPHTLTLALPFCSPTQILLDLPFGQRPSVTQGVLVRDHRGEEGDNGRWRWSLATNGGEVVVRLQDAANGQQGRPIAHQQTTFEATTSRLLVSSTWKLDCERAPLSQARIRISDELQVFQVLLDDEPLPWSLEAADDAAATSVELQAQFS